MHYIFDVLLAIVAEVTAHYNFITYNTKMKAVTIMKEKYFPILRAILKNKNVPEDSLEIIKKDDFIIFLSSRFFDITNFEILNTFGQIGVKFELITAYEKNGLVETQVIIRCDEFEKVEKYFE